MPILSRYQWEMPVSRDTLDYVRYRPVQRAMRHTSPETKRRYQLGMTDQVRQAVEKSNEKAYGGEKVLRFYDVRPDAKKEGAKAVCN